MLPEDSTGSVSNPTQRFLNEQRPYKTFISELFAVDFASVMMMKTFRSEELASGRNLDGSAAVEQMMRHQIWFGTSYYFNYQTCWSETRMMTSLQSLGLSASI